MSSLKKEPMVVTAAAAAAVPAQIQEVVLPLPQGSPHTGLVFAADAHRPLHVAQINVEQNSQLKQHDNITGLYVVALRLTDIGITISHFRTVADLDRILGQTYLHQRELVLLTAPPVLSLNGILYVYEMPTDEAPGQNFTLDGFPPRIQSMAPTSPLNVVLRPGLFVVSLIVPQMPDFLYTSPGFTGYGVQVRINQTAHIPGRWLSFCEASPVPAAPKKSTNKWFDFGGILAHRKPKAKR